MKSVIVSKFGGTSLSNSEQFSKVKKIIFSNADRKYIVVSAPGKFKNEHKITDYLENCYIYLCEKNYIRFDFEYSIVAKRYKEIVESLGINIDIDTMLLNVKHSIMTDIDRDYIVSRGEYMSAIILSEYLGYEFVDSTELFIFSDEGMIDINETIVNIRNKLKNYYGVIIPGFYGIDKNGKIKTFSRGGSDISAAILSIALQADLYENWTDVCGLMSADPNIVKNTFKINNIPYSLAKKIFKCGTILIHQDVMDVFEENFIPINIKNTNDELNDGTLISCDKDYWSENEIFLLSIKENMTIFKFDLAFSEECKYIVNYILYNYNNGVNMYNSLKSSYIFFDSNIEINKLILDFLKQKFIGADFTVFKNVCVYIIISNCQNIGILFEKFNTEGILISDTIDKTTDVFFARSEKSLEFAEEIHKMFEVLR